MISIRRRRWLIFSPVVGAAATTLGNKRTTCYETLKGFAARGTPSGFVIGTFSIPKVLASLEPWAEISQRLRRIRLNLTDADLVLANPCFDSQGSRFARTLGLKLANAFGVFVQISDGRRPGFSETVLIS